LNGLSSNEDIERRLHDAAQDALERHKVVRELLRLSGADPEIPFPPTRMRTEMTVEPRRIRFLFPVAGYGPGDIALTVAGAAAVLGLRAFLRWRGYAGTVPQEWWLAAATVLAAALGFRAWVLATRQVALTVSHERLEWVRQGSLRRRRESFERDEIAHLVLPPSPKNPVRGDPPTLMGFPLRPLRERRGIVVRSAGRSIEFGRNLSYVELRWIHALIARVLGLRDE
jgi:hypothetical protein